MFERRVKKGFTCKITKEPFIKGSKFSSDDEERINELIESGHLEGDKVTPKPKVSDKTMTELKELAEEKGIEVEGTGKNGAVKKDDLVKALEG